MEVLHDVIQIVTHRRETSRKIARENSIVSSLPIVCGFGAATSLLFAVSYLAHDYPPPPDELDVWIDAWGEFAVLPFVKVTAERYRLILALIIVPLTLAI